MNTPTAKPTPTAWTTGSTEVFRTGTWRASVPVHRAAASPCREACPVNGEIAHWINQARAGDRRGAWETLVRHNPFPAITGRVCHHPCETACNRGQYDEALAICRLERYVGDAALEHGWHFAQPPPPDRGRIAVIGGGPAGLSAAYQLRRAGFAVTVLEARAELGGLLRYGIPAYRLPRAVLDAEIARVLALGIEVRTETRVAGSAELERLRAQFDAVFLAPGAERQKQLPGLDAFAPWVVNGATYLAQAAAGAPPVLGRRVVVVGGGSAAIDVARTALRYGHAVTVLALESEAQLPAQREEVLEAREEGVQLRTAAMLRSAHPKAEGVVLDCMEVQFEPGLERGEFRVTPIEDKAFELETDAVIVSIGQDPDLDAIGTDLARKGRLLQIDAGHATSTPGVFAGGDVASHARFVTEAIAAGKRAAARLAQAGDAVGASAATPVLLESINTFYYPRAPRAALECAPPARVHGFAEVQLGLDADAARTEAERCFSCGHCVFCDNCVHYCPDLAMARVDGGYRVLTDYCKGCGVCARECPTGTIRMQEEAR